MMGRAIGPGISRTVFRRLNVFDEETLFGKELPVQNHHAGRHPVANKSRAKNAAATTSNHAPDSTMSN